jgi:hypothetical protein
MVATTSSTFDRDGEAAEHMAALARLAQLERGAAGDDLLAEGDEGGQEVAQVSCSGRPPFSASMLQPNEVCSGVKR